MKTENIAEKAEGRGFERRGKSNLIRKINDVLQLINFQKSNFSDEWYVNFAVWPEALGKPIRLAENVFPLRGRIEDVLGEDGAASEADLEKFFETVDRRYSSLNALRTALAEGQLDGMYVKVDLRTLLAG